MTDPYDQAHPETGSSNISKASPEWLEVLEEARLIQATTQPLEDVLHIAYGLINEGGAPWAKCPNCGSPFRADWGKDTVCSDKCHQEYLHYLNSYES